MMNHQIDIQNACILNVAISDENLITWAQMALNEYQKAAELTIRLVDTDEITDLNKTYRKQNKPTNVLAFPGNIPDSIELEYPFLGDVIICPAVLLTESIEQNISLEAHWAHIVIHGILHLLGYDHIDELDEKTMQTIEVKLLAKLGFANPYNQEGNDIE